VTKGGRFWCTRGRSGWIQLLDEQNKMKGRESGGGRRETPVEGEGREIGGGRHGLS